MTLRQPLFRQLLECFLIKVLCDARLMDCRANMLVDYDAAFLVGQKTTGKGYFQTTFELSDGSAVNLSIGKYYTPSGKSLTGVGITPDQVVELSEEAYSSLYYGTLTYEEDVQLQTAVNYLRQKIS